jgi:hypothetical protein
MIMYVAFGQLVISFCRVYCLHMLRITLSRITLGWARKEGWRPVARADREEIITSFSFR